MKYNTVESLYVFSYGEFVKFMEHTIELFPLKGSHEKARSSVYKLYQKPEAGQYSYIVSNNHDSFLFLSFKQEGKLAVMTDCLYHNEHPNANVLLSEWLIRLDGIFRYFNIEQYQMELKDALLDMEKMFDECIVEETGITVIRYLDDTKTGVVLGGGGARGSYQLGAWQYFEEIDLVYDIVTGASVGALNGALMVQRDWGNAQAMWHHIETTDVLNISSFPQFETYDLPTLLEGMGSMTLEAILNQGISTAPLYEYVTKLLNHDRLSQAKASLWVTTTHLFTMEEKVIDIQSCEPEQRADWLIASASFFPALAPHQINGEYYVDGGYRNNVPVDVAIKQGANQLFVMDVKGPGVTKNYDMPLTITPIILKSPWLLGNMLLFDGQRAKWNQQLGYLELKRQMEKRCGFWYTFNVQDMSKDYFRINRELVHYLLRFLPKSFFKNKNMEIIYERLRISYMSRVSAYNLGWVILELTGKLYGLDPTHYYSVETFCRELSERLLKETTLYSPANLYSLPEWLAFYHQSKSVFSEQSQVERWLARFQKVGFQKKWLELGILVQPDTFLIACFIWGLQTERKGEGVNVKRV